MQASIDLVKQRADEFEKKFGTRPQMHQHSPCVKMFSELCDEARARFDGDFDEYVKGLIKGWQKEKYEMQTIAIMAVRKIYEMSGNSQPMVIISIIPPYYPDCYPKYEDPKVKNLMEKVADVIKTAKDEYGEELVIKDFYGLSDLSYTDLDPSMDFTALFKNVVGVNQMYTLPVEDMKTFHIPSSIVLGGYGKDFHKTTERLHLKYNYDVLPYLYVQLIDDLLG